MLYFTCAWFVHHRCHQDSAAWSCITFYLRFFHNLLSRLSSPNGKWGESTAALHQYQRYGRSTCMMIPILKRAGVTDPSRFTRNGILHVLELIKNYQQQKQLRCKWSNTKDNKQNTAQTSSCQREEPKMERVERWIKNQSRHQKKNPGESKTSRTAHRDAKRERTSAKRRDPPMLL